MTNTTNNLEIPNTTTAYKIAFQTALGRNKTPIFPQLSEIRWINRQLAESFCNGINTYRQVKFKHSSGRYIVVEE